MKKIYIVGIGMGNPDTITVRGKRIVEESPAIIGAKRMVESFPEARGVRGFGILADDIFKWILQRPEEQVAVLMSGDVGFYSGAKKLARLVESYNEGGRPDSNQPDSKMELELIPGISSLQYFCAKLGRSWDDAKIVSLHGREGSACGPVQTNRKTFFLTGSDHKAEEICGELTRAGLGETKIYVGERLSYDDERITVGTAVELGGRQFDTLAVVLAENDRAADRPETAHGLADECFTRGNVPMTKQEVRSVTLSKLEIRRNDVVYDVGAGTGSVSVEMALLAREGQVYAIETNPDAVALIEENKKAFGVCNLRVVPGKAPAALTALPAPDKVFLGGTKGNMAEILRILFEKNPNVLIVVNAIALETLSEAVECLKAEGCAHVDVVQLSAARAREVGRYHMMTAQNPVFIITGRREHGRAETKEDEAESGSKK